MFESCTEVQHQAFAGLQFLEHEQCNAVGIGVRHEGFFAECRKLTVADLSADHAVQRAQRLVPGFDAGFIALVLEGGADLAIFELAVLVVGVAGIEFQRSERTVQVAHLRGEGVMVLLHAQADVLFGRRAVVGIVVTVGKAAVTIIPGIGPTQCAAVLAAVAVAQAVLLVVVAIAPGIGALSVTGNAQVVERA
ncbi:hypothetical protein D3C80_1243500 [compost metagenome]